MVVLYKLHVVHELFKGVVTTGKCHKPKNTLTPLVDMPAPGFIRLISFSQDGLQICHDNEFMVIPMKTLLNLAESVVSGFVPPPAQEVAAGNAENTAMFENLALSKF